MPTDSFTPALARLEPANRALLDLSLRRGMRPEEIGDLLGTDPESVIVAREAALEQLGAELGLDETPDLDDLRARLSALPDEAWTGQAQEEAEPEADAEAAEETDSEPQPHLTLAEAPAEPGEREEPREAGKRKSRLPLLLALLAVAAVVLVIVLASGGSGDDGNTASNTPAPKSQKPAKKPSKPASKPSKPAEPSKPAQPAASPEVKLTAVTGAGSATGTASLSDGGKRLHLEVSGLPSGSYEVWLYDSVVDAQSIGKADGTSIKLDVALPQNASQYRYIDVSREPADGNPNHSGESVLRVPLAKLSP